VVWRQFPFELRPNRHDFEAQRSRVQGDGARFDGKNALIEAVQRRMKITVRRMREMQNQVKPRVTRLKRAAIRAIERDALRPGVPGGQQADGQKRQHGI